MWWLSKIFVNQSIEGPRSFEVDAEAMAGLEGCVGSLQFPPTRRFIKSDLSIPEE
jgi:hypothetical protein